MPRYQSKLARYEDEVSNNNETEKSPLEYPGWNPADRVFGLLVTTRREIEAVHESSQMPDTDLPHYWYPPSLSERQERSYRFINGWKDNLLADGRVDDTWFERDRVAEKSGQYNQYFKIETITLHVKVGQFEIQLTPTNSDCVVVDDNQIWSGEILAPQLSTPFTAQLEELDNSLSVFEDRC